ncbi:PEX5 [Symbiodinium natans]|uniref:PEX5 protein n=1 Tax=Symbiodinium natans TaxID=878477 RepID=A0A812UPM6_9DINO|nr:PEX5 [Symbiodinium natans]
MRPFFKPDSCSVDGLAGNPLSRAFDSLTADKHHAQQMREGYLSGIRPPLGALGGQMMDPMMGPSELENAWREAGPGMRGPRMGPGPGATMSDQLRQHMEGPGLGAEPGLFDGPMVGPAMPVHAGPDWAQEFAAHHGPQAFRPPMMGPVGPVGPDWASEFAVQGTAPPAMESAWQQAQMAGPAGAGPASSSTAMSSSGPVGPMMGPMMAPMMGPMMGMGMGPMLRAPHQAGPSLMPAPAMMASAPAVSTDVASKEAAPIETLAEAPQVEEADLGQAAQMVEMLRNSGNTKLANSKFVNFIDLVSKGDLQFKENTVVDRDGNQVDWEALYDTDVATVTDNDRAHLDTMWKASAGPAGMEAVLNRVGLDHPLGMEDFEGDLALGMANHREALQEALGREEADHLLEQMMQGLDGFDASTMDLAAMSRAKEYKFAEENPFREISDPLAEAIRLIREGRDREALLCLESEVQRNPESSEGWRMLGQLYAELDQDIEAIQCLRRGHEVDPYNLDSLLALGVSCTNELDQLPALRYLRTWLENHEEHQAIADRVEAPPDYEYDAWRRQVTELFQQAAQANPHDADVFVALGVLENINRDFPAAVQALATACRLRPNDPTVWNKLGATLANSGKSEQAVVAYHQGLELKPNYARSWSNMAIAHANLGKHKDAARLYLSSLVLNPEATHTWNFLQSAVLNMNMDSQYALEATEAIEQRDLKAATQIIDGVLDPAKLPKPLDQPTRPPDEILSSIGL